MPEYYKVIIIIISQYKYNYKCDIISPLKMKYVKPLLLIQIIISNMHIGTLHSRYSGSYLYLKKEGRQKENKKPV